MIHSALASAGALCLSKRLPVGAIQESPADFAQAKSVAARRKFDYFPSGNPKNYVFRRAITDRPYRLECKLKFFDKLSAPAEAGALKFKESLRKP
ncbi:MAG: hypothetical protein IJX04_04940 [Oscillospiraceae bacterium]|nr:hypothetical protein [Oscillospiraceae bacterium]